MPETQGAGGRVVLTYLPMALMSGSMGLMYVNSKTRTTTWLIMGLMAIASLVMVVGHLAASAARNASTRLVATVRTICATCPRTAARSAQFVVQQRQAQAWRHPDPRSLWSVAMTTRRWERRPAHPDFGEFRVGTGGQRLAVRITPMQTKPIEDLEPVSAHALRRFIRAYTTVDDQPIALFVRGIQPDQTVRRPRRRPRGGARASRPTGDLPRPGGGHRRRTAAGEQSGTWEWVKWLPHAQHASNQDAAGPLRLVSDTSRRAGTADRGRVPRTRGIRERGGAVHRPNPTS